MWLASLNRCWTADRLGRRSVLITMNNSHYVCGGGERAAVADYFMCVLTSVFASDLCCSWLDLQHQTTGPDDVVFS